VPVGAHAALLVRAAEDAEGAAEDAEGAAEDAEGAAEDALRREEPGVRALGAMADLST
jgi:hypothetical protein